MKKKEVIKFLKSVRIEEVELERTSGEFGWTDATGVMHPSESGFFTLTLRGVIKSTKKKSQ